MIIGFVGAFGWVLTYSKFPFAVAASIASIAPEWWLFLLLVIALYIVSRPLLPFLAAIVAVLLFLAFVPEIVLYLPRALGFTR
jgi:TRAP-type C4-dicarboxylate transport system permease large subunit